MVHEPWAQGWQEGKARRGVGGDAAGGGLRQMDGDGGQKLPFQIQKTPPASTATGSGTHRGWSSPSTAGSPPPRQTTQNEATGTGSAGGGDRGEWRTSTFVSVVPLCTHRPARPGTVPMQSHHLGL